MAKKIELSVILSAYDKMSTVVKLATDKSASALDKLKAKSAAFGQNAGQIASSSAMIAASTAAALAGPIKAYADLEDASERLKVTLLHDGNKVDALFTQVNDLAIKLGNDLPGTTADFQNMFSVLAKNGVDAKSILGGVGEAAAKMAVVMNLPMEETAQMAARLKVALGIADTEMVGFMDQMARMVNIGVKSDEMTYAFTRSAGGLKSLHIQGLEANKAIMPLYGMLIRTGLSGETVGTQMNSLFDSVLNPKKMEKMNEEAAKFGLAFKFTDNKGNFAGIQNMIVQLEQLRGVSDTARAAIINALTGGGADSQIFKTLSVEGREGYNRMVEQMKNQATLEQKVQRLQGTLKNMWDAASGTFINTLAAFGDAISPELKQLTEWFGKLSEKIQGFVKNNPKIAKFIGLFMVGVVIFSGVIAVIATMVFWWNKLSFVFGIVSPLISGITKGLWGMARAALANPYILLAVAIIATIYIIYRYWNDFMKWWGRQGEAMKFVVRLLATPFLGFIAVIRGVIVGIQKGWKEGLKEFARVIAEFSLVKSFVTMFDAVFQYLGTIYDKMLEAGGKIIDQLVQGIKNKAHEMVDAIKDATSKMREYLPFSPAKKGAFRDLHKVKIIETIAQSIKPAPLTRAMRLATMTAVSAVPMAAHSTVASGSNTNSSMGITVNYSPSINMAGGTNMSKDDIISVLKQHGSELAKIVDEQMRLRNRGKF